MESRKITGEEQSCISNCITTFWGDPESQEDVSSRDRDYEACLSDCQICG